MQEVLDYRRGVARPTVRPSATLALVVLTVAAFVLQNLAEALNFSALYPEFALSVDGLRHGHVWQLITFQFLHLPLIEGGALHFLGNLFVIYVFGRVAEGVMGRWGVLKLFLLGGTVGGLLQMAGGLLAPQQFGSTVVGASAGAMSLLAAVATLQPRRKLHLFFLPIPVRADVLLALAVVVTVTGLFLPSGHVAHCAHLGGLLTGFMLARRHLRRNRTPAVYQLPAKCSLEMKPVAD